LHCSHIVGVDGWKESLDKAKENNTHTEYVLADVTSLRTKFKEKEFDAVVALDLIEHLPEAGGTMLMKDMEWIAAKKVVIFTPNGFLPQKAFSGNVLQEHLSGWSSEQMREAGYKVVGMYGPRVLRGELQAIRFRPKTLWVILSELCQWGYIRWRPESAAALLCTKQVNQGC